jgi:DNA-binding PadR family transcriptional regulator
MFHRFSNGAFGKRYSRHEPDEALRGHRHRGGRAGLTRFFAHGDLRLVIAQLIAEKPRYGYEIIKAIEEQAAGAYTPSPGVVYPTLTLLEELGYVTVRAGEAGRKQHEITPQGTAFLEANRATVDGLRARMSEAARVHGGGPAPQIMRAMENLKLALRLRLGRGPLDEAQIRTIAAALDAAAGQVEGA